MSGDFPTNELRLKRIKKYIDRMPSLSTTVSKVLEVCNRPNTSPNDLNRVISLDPVLTGQVLKLINSAYYSLPNQITSLPRAIIMLGINTVKNLSLSTAVLGSIGKTETVQSFPMDRFWTHSLCVGVAAKALAAVIKIPQELRDEYFVAGLLHDLGKIPLAACFVEEYAQVLQLAALEQNSLLRAENLILGLDHCVVGALIGEKWQLTDIIVESLSNHHSPEKGKAETRLLSTVVSLANIYANTYEVGSAGDNYPEPRTIASTLELANLQWRQLSGLQENVREEIEKAQVFLEISKGTN